MLGRDTQIELSQRNLKLNPNSGGTIWLKKLQVWQNSITCRSSNLSTACRYSFGISRREYRTILQEFNSKTADKQGLIIPVVVTIYQDKSFTFIIKTPPAAVLLKKAAGIESGSREAK